MLINKYKTLFQNGLILWFSQVLSAFTEKLLFWFQTRRYHKERDQTIIGKTRQNNVCTCNRKKLNEYICTAASTWSDSSTLSILYVEYLNEEWMNTPVST